MNDVGKRTDSELYSSFLRGDTTSYNQLMIRHGDSLTLYLYGYLHDWHDAEDLMIESFARLMVKRPKIGDGSFKAYLFKTARNLASRFHSKHSRVKQFSFEEYSASGNEPADEGLVEVIVIREEQRQILHLCMDRIDPELKEALWLVYMEDMSYTEAASVMKVNTKRIDHLLQRGKKEMRAELEKEGVTSAYRQ